jgi:hypothetical protein
MAIRIPVFLIAFLTLPILAAEQPVSAPVIQPASSLPLRYSPSIAFGSSTILVVWHEQFSDIYPEANAQLMARLFRKDGTTLRNVQFPLGYGIRPRAVWNGSEYLIAYSVPVSRFNTFPRSLLGMLRVTEDGEIVSSTTFGQMTITPDLGAFAMNGDRAILIATNGAYLIDRDGKNIATKPEIAGDVTAFGDGFASAAISGGSLSVRTYTRDGNLIATIPIDINASSARIGAHGDQLAVVWSSGQRIVATTIDQGAVAAPITLANVIDPRAGSVTWGGDAWMSAWQSGPFESPRACASRFSGAPAPSPAGAVSVCSPTATRDPFIASDGATVAMSWIDGVISSSFINPNKTLASFAPAGRVPEFDRGRVISEAARPQHLLTTADGPGATWIVWNESFPDRNRVFLRGGQAPLVQLPITRADAAQLVAGDQTMLLVWTSGPFANIYASRLDAEGNLLDFPVGLGVGRDPRAAFDGHEWLIVFESSDPDTAYTQIRASTFDENGTATFGVPIESNLQLRQSAPRIAWTGSKFLVTWYAQPALENAVATARLVDAHGYVVSRTLQFTDRGVDSVACGPSSCVMTSDRKVGYVTTSLLQIGPVLSIPTNGVVRSLGDDSFAIDAFTPNGLIETVVDKAAHVVGTRRLLDVVAAGIVLPSTIVYERTTRADEPYGGALRIFTQERPEGRRRPVRH